MPDISLSNAIILIGIACVVAAIVGSGIKFSRIKVRAISSLRRQILLAAFGFVLIAIGSIAAIRSLAPGSEQAGGTRAQTPDGNVIAPNNALEQTRAIRSRIEITSLAPNQRVAARELVRGRAPPGTQQIWLIVHPRETDECWAQGPGTANADGTWQIMGLFGEAGSQHAGKPYEVRAIASPRSFPDMRLEAGPVSCGLDALLHSEWVNAVRI